MKIIYTIILASISFTCIGQQEQMFTQYMYNKMAINPAFAGNEDYLGLTAQLRDQWNGFPGAPEAQLLSVNLPRIKENVGVGFNLRRRTIGINKEYTASGIYAYKFLLGPGTLSMGLEASIRNRTTDFTDDRIIATQGIDIDPSIPSEKINKTFANLGFGIYWNTDKYFLGASVPKLIKNEIDFDNNDIVSTEVRHLMIMGGGIFKLNNDLDLSVQSLLKFAEQAPFDSDLTFGLILNKKYTAAMGYRLGGSDGDVGESIALLLSFQLTDQFMIGFSQDFTLSKIRKYDNGSFEMVASYAFGKSSERVVLLNPRYF
jgi:type IX secretion system PorP/SprF family membrane protein